MPRHVAQSTCADTQLRRKSVLPGLLLLGQIVLVQLVFGLSSTWADERRYYFDTGGSEFGLAQHTVNDFFQDHAGFVWIATQGGLNEYDGYRFHLFQHDADDPDSLPDSFVNAIAEDDRDQIWVGSNTHNIARLDPISGKAQAFVLPDNTPDVQKRNAVSALKFDPQRGLWIGTAAGIELFDVKSGQRKEIFRFDNRQAGTNVVQFVASSDGSLLAATSIGLLRIARNADVAKPVAADALNVAAALLVTADARTYVGNAEGLFRVDTAQGRAQRIWPTDSERVASDSHSVRAVAEDGQGRLWMAINGEGLAIFYPGDGHVDWLRHSRDLPGSLPEKYELSLFVDRSGLLWVGGLAHGFATTDPAGAVFRYITDFNAAPGTDNNVRAIWEDPQHRLWLGTDSAGLKRYDGATGKFESFNDVLEQAQLGRDASVNWRITALQDGGNGKVWVGTHHGAFLLDPQKRQASAVPIDPDHGQGLPDALVHSLLSARDGSVWFGMFGSGLAHWWPGTTRWEFFRHSEEQSDSLAHDVVLDIYEDKDSRIWIGTLNGLNLYDPRQQSMRRFRHVASDGRSLSDNLVRAVYQSSDGAVWIATHSGLDRLETDAKGDMHFSRFSTRNGLPSATIYAILEDHAGNLWLSSNRGISLYDRELGIFHNFSLKDGLQALEFNGGAAYKLANGELAFGGINGTNVFDPATIKFNNFQAPVVITSMLIGRESKPLRPDPDMVRVDQSERIVRFEFASLDYAAPERNEFIYRLQGFDDDWIKAGTRHDATYTNLPAGDYRFQVRASNRDGIWNDKGVSLPLTIVPPWWASRAMQVVYALLAIGAILGIWMAVRRRNTRERRRHREIIQREDRLRMALWGSGDTFWDWDLRRDELVITGVSDLLHSAPDDSPMSATQWIEDNIHPDDRAVVDQRISDHANGLRDQFESEHRALSRGGQWVWVFVRGKIVERSNENLPLRICGTARDITASRAAERERRIAAEVIDSMTEAVCVTDLDFCFVSVNRAFTRMTGYDEHAVIGHSAALLNCSKHTSQHYQMMRDDFLRHGHWRGELWQKRKDDEEFLCWLEISVVDDAAGDRTHYVGVMTDITDRKRAEQELRYLANYDTLTGLPNRTLLAERLGQAVIRARRTSRKVALLFLDLDRFKHVNDSMGHSTGDRMLKAAGARLRSSVKEADTVARLGGDEFTVVLEDLHSVHDAEALARKLITAFARPLHLETGEEVVISPSIGISLYPDHGQVPTELLKFADTAMYQAKDRGRNTYMVYTRAMDTAVRSRAHMIAALHKGLERDELSLVYQPKLSLLDKRITGVEALLRWHSEELGDVPPAVFIPLAEETGLIVKIGEFVLKQACAQLRRWHDLGQTDIGVAVNLSMLQLLRGDLTLHLKEILAAHGLPAEKLEMELTESMVMANAEQSVRTLTELKTIGVTLAIDDFGTGYSSLAYLKRLPIDTLKIDQTFVGDITTDPDDEAITATIISMAHSLGLNVVAEGVETLEQLEYLREQGCDEIQGHWFSRPLQADACYTFIDLFTRSQKQAASV